MSGIDPSDLDDDEDDDWPSTAGNPGLLGDEDEDEAEEETGIELD